MGAKGYRRVVKKEYSADVKRYDGEAKGYTADAKGFRADAKGYGLLQVGLPVAAESKVVNGVTVIGYDAVLESPEVLSDYAQYPEGMK
eukprot:660711-Prorocentrum_minimum.AAC.1